MWVAALNFETDPSGDPPELWVSLVWPDRQAGATPKVMLRHALEPPKPPAPTQEWEGGTRVEVGFYFGLAVWDLWYMVYGMGRYAAYPTVMWSLMLCLGLRLMMAECICSAG